MPQSLSKVYLHLIFHIKTTSVRMMEKDWEHIHAYMACVLNDMGCNSICVGGTDDHVHILFLLSRNTTISKAVEDVKRHSSRWIKTLAPSYAKFEWQGGYGMFSVSQSVVNNVVKYIKNQKVHHRKMTFAEEYALFLNEYGVEYDERYVFRD